jgi:ArsR family transcriptional regulator
MSDPAAKIDRGASLDPEPFFHALSDEIRRRILCLIVDQDELCVCELFYALDLPQPKVSRHLAVLRDGGVLALRREATRVYYRLHPALPPWAHRVLTAMAEGVTLRGMELCDVERLVSMPNRPRRGVPVAAG